MEGYRVGGRIGRGRDGGRGEVRVRGPRSEETLELFGAHHSLMMSSESSSEESDPR